MRCPDCGKAIFYPRECDGRPHKLDADPVPDGAYVIVAWNARVHGKDAVFIGHFDPVYDEDEARYSDHQCVAAR